MNKRYCYFILVIQSVIIAFLLVYLVFSLGNQEKVESLEASIAIIEQRQSNLRHRNDSLSLLIQRLRISNAIPPFLDSSQLEDLMKKGLENPVEELRDDLVGDPELIRSSGVLGGSMGFYFHDGIHILNKRWVFAYFEDGHMAGAILLRYEIDDRGSISWEVIDETLY